MGIRKKFPVNSFLKTVKSELQTFGAQLGGGDTTRCSTSFFSLCVIGKTIKETPRESAPPYYNLYLSGYPGESALGFEIIRKIGIEFDRNGSFAIKGQISQHPYALEVIKKHLLPTPRFDITQWAVKQKKTIFITDLSDSLIQAATYLTYPHGFEINFDSIPVKDDFIKLSEELGIDYKDIVLYGGEDYHLLLAIPPNTNPPAGTFKIGKVTKEGNVVTNYTPGKTYLEGWDIFK